MGNVPKIKRRPFRINNECVGVIELYRRPLEISDEFGWLWEALGNDDDFEWEKEAEELVSQIHEESCIKFLKGLRDSCDKKIKEWEEMCQKYGI